MTRRRVVPLSRAQQAQVPQAAWSEAPQVLARSDEETDVIGNIALWFLAYEGGAYALAWDRAAARAQRMLAGWR